MNDPITFPSASPRYGLPYLFSGQAQKEFFVNEAHAMIDALLHPAVEGLATAPPTTMSEGDVWLVDTGATGDWAGEDGMLAVAARDAWIFVAPTEGMTVYDKSLGQTQHFRTEWNVAAPPTSPNGGATVDAEARAAIDELIENLRSAGIISEI